MLAAVVSARRGLEDEEESEDDIECNIINLNSQEIRDQEGFKDECEFIRSERTECEHGSAFDFLDLYYCSIKRAAPAIAPIIFVPLAVSKVV